MGRPNIHFIGIENVVNAYKHMKVPAFAVFSGKELMYSCDTDDAEDGEDQLRAYLELMEGRNWEHLKLKVYRDVSGKGIKSGTDYDGSFNFQLNETPEGYQQIGGIGNILLSRLSAVEKKLAEQNNDDEPDDNDDFGLGQIGRALNHPAILPLVEPLTNKLLDWVTGTNTPTVTHLSGIPGEPKYDPAEVDKAVKRLKSHVPDLAALLNKLADMAEKKPVQFKMYMGIFGSMKI